MRVLVLGGTGTIGAAVVDALIRAGHAVVALARSEAAALRLAAAGAKVLAGDIRRPAEWLDDPPPVDGAIHAASDYADDMGPVDTRLLDALLPALARTARPGGPPPRLVYTGGCWLYGATGDRVASETTAFDPLPAFAWMVPNLARVLAAEGIDGRVVHPAMVYTGAGGVLAGMVRDARMRGEVRIAGDTAVRWPLVHADDLARLYVLVLERGRRGGTYHGVAVDGLPVGALARAVAARHGGPACRVVAVDADAIAAARGEWARGYALDQRMGAAATRRALGWRPLHTDPLADIAAAPAEPAPEPSPGRGRSTR